MRRPMSRSSIVFGVKRQSITERLSNSRADLEAIEGTDTLANWLNPRHGRRWRSLLASLQHRLDRVRRALKHGFYRSVPPIANPSVKTQLNGVHLDEGSKANALHTPLNPDLNGTRVHLDNARLD